MTDRVAQFVWGLAAALLVAFLVFTVGVDQLSAGVGPFFLMALSCSARSSPSWRS